MCEDRNGVQNDKSKDVDEEELPVIDYINEYRKQTGKDLETGEYVTQ